MTPKLPRAGGPVHSRAQKHPSPPTQRQFALQLVAVRLQETNEAAKMVLVAVAEHNYVDRRGINDKQIRVVEKCFRRVTEINQDIAHLAAAPRFDLHREAEFADQCPAWRLVAETPAKVLNIKAGQLLLGATAN